MDHYQDPHPQKQSKKLLGICAEYILKKMKLDHFYLLKNSSQIILEYY